MAAAMITGALVLLSVGLGFMMTSGWQPRRLVTVFVLAALTSLGVQTLLRLLDQPLWYAMCLILVGLASGLAVGHVLRERLGWAPDEPDVRASGASDVPLADLGDLEQRLVRAGAKEKRRSERAVVYTSGSLFEWSILGRSLRTMNAPVLVTLMVGEDPDSLVRFTITGRTGSLTSSELARTPIRRRVEQLESVVLRAGSGVD